MRKCVAVDFEYCFTDIFHVSYLHQCNEQFMTLCTLYLHLKTAKHAATTSTGKCCYVSDRHYPFILGTKKQ